MKQESNFFRFIAQGVKEKAPNAVLIKLNQMGILTEAIESTAICRQVGWGFVISHRSGQQDVFHREEERNTADY